MYSPIWITPNNIGVYSSGKLFSLQLNCKPVSPRTSLTFKFLAGTLPAGTTLNTAGLLSGVLTPSEIDKVYSFVVRATDNYGTISDRSFRLKVTKTSLLSFITSSGNILSTLDSIWINTPIKFRSIQTPSSITIISGALPDGLYITNTGVINGYALPPTDAVSGAPIVKTFNFTVGIDVVGILHKRTFSITVSNSEITKPGKVRKPVIVNYNKLSPNISSDDPYNNYYIPTKNIGIVNFNDKFNFKIIGHDFDSSRIVYTYIGLPTGLTGDTDTGWIYGTSNLLSKGISTFKFSVVVSKADNPSIKSSALQFELTLVRDINPSITWTSSTNLGQVNNGSILNAKISARCQTKLVYSVTAGSLPPNIILSPSGELTGRISYNPLATKIVNNSITKFSFTVTAYSELYPLISSSKNFELNVYQKYSSPHDIAYFKASLDIHQRNMLSALLDESIIPSSLLYRPNDSNFGKSKPSIKIPLSYGLTPSTLTKYIASVEKNHYNKNITMSPLKIAKVINSSNTVLYEVLYSEALDDLSNELGSVPADIAWPNNIAYQQNNFVVTNTQVGTNITIPTSSTPGFLRVVHPNSFEGMNSYMTSIIPQSTDDSLLPAWMTSQQSSGDTIGFIRAWVLCYTLPGKAQEIKNNIESKWGHSMNEFNIVMDRFFVDKSASYEWNPTLTTPTWASLTNEYVADSRDYVVLFPRNNILPSTPDFL